MRTEEWRRSSFHYLNLEKPEPPADSAIILPSRHTELLFNNMVEREINPTYVAIPYQSRTQKPRRY